MMRRRSVCRMNIPTARVIFLSVFKAASCNDEDNFEHM